MIDHKELPKIIVGFCYKEAEAIKKLELEIRKLKNFSDNVVFIDGNSQDGTLELLKDMDIECIEQQSIGLRAAYATAFEYIEKKLLELNCTNVLVVTISPDGNTFLQDCNKIFSALEGNMDLVIGSRYLKGAGSDDDNFITKFGNFFFTKLINTLFHVKLSDSFVMFRGYSYTAIRNLKLLEESSYRFPEKILKTKLGVEPLMSVRAAIYGLRISEVPSKELARIGGERKLQVIKWGLGYLYQIFFEYYNLKIRTRRKYED
jgi:glycosyltransferase involved in cell wall biosynthesis